MTETLFIIVTFYKFSPIEEARLDEIEQALNECAARHQIMGLFILGTEGCNSTVSGSAESIERFKSEIQEILNIGPLLFKESQAPKHPFFEFKVKRRSEIVTLHKEELVPSGNNNHLSPEEWDQAMQDPNTVVLDTRNSYEYEVGHFKNAVNPNMRMFGQFPDYLKKAELDKDKKYLIYCTGGIRCEKAILEMEKQGFKNVFQLEGGILNYLKQKPNNNYNGECFVFDYRIAVDQELSPTTTFQMCPHCGQPGKTPIECSHCEAPAVVCDHCIEKSPDLKTCSKNCAHHHRMGHKCRKKHFNPEKPRSLQNL